MAGEDVSVKFGAQVGALLSGVEQAKASIESLAAPVTAIKSSFVGLAEAAGVAFAVDKIVEWTKKTTEAAERATNLAAAIGIVPEQFQKLSAAMEIAGASGESAARTMERLQRNLSTAMADSTSRSARAFTDLGITQKQLSATGGNLDAVLHLLANSFEHFEDGPNKTAAFIAILGRGFESLIPLLRGGSAGMDELKRKAEEVGGVLTGQTIKALADSAEKMNTLGVAASGLGSNLIAQLKPMIDAVTTSLTNMIAALNRALGMASGGAAGRFSDLTQQLADINRQIAEKGEPRRITHGPRFGELETPAADTSTEARRMTHGPRFGQVDTADNSLAGLQARAAEIQGQLKDIGLGIATQGLADVGYSKPAAGNSAGAKAGGKGAAGPKDNPAFDAAFSLQMADAGAQERIGSLYMAKYSKDQEALVKVKTISVGEMIQGEMTYSAQLFKLEDARLVKAIEIANSLVATSAVEQAKITADQLRAYEARLVASARYEAQKASLQEKAAAAQQKLTAAWAAPFKTAFDQIGSSFESAITGLLDRSKTLAQTWTDIANSITKAAISLAGSVLSKVAGGLLGGKPGEGIGDVLGNKVANWAGSKLADWGINKVADAGVNAATNLATGAATGAATAAETTIPIVAAVTAAQAAQEAGIAASTLAIVTAIEASATEISIAVNIPKPLGLARGGIVPAAAGGWSLPSSFGTDSVMAALTPGEMVLPKTLADNIRGGVVGGGGNGGGSDMHLHFHGPSDGPSVERWFKGMMGRNPGVVSNMLRSNALTPRTI
jgi:hypothetical protein